MGLSILAGGGVEYYDAGDFYDLAQTGAKKRSGRLEYLTNPLFLSDFFIKQELLEHVLRPIKGGGDADSFSGDGGDGSNMTIYVFDGNALRERLIEWRKKVEGGRQEPDEGELTAIGNMAQEIADRFVFKMGNTKDFNTSFWPGSEASRFKRVQMEYVFARGGFKVVNTPERVGTLAGEQARAALYLGNEQTESIVGPHFFAGIRKFLQNPCEFGGWKPANCLVEDDRVDALTSTSGSTVAEVCKEVEGDDYESYVARNRELREPDISKYEQYLQPFFDAFAQMGVSHTLRRMFFLRKPLDFEDHEKHTPLDWEQAKKLLEELSEKWKNVSFLLPVHTSYGYVPRSGEKWAEIGRDNEEAVRTFKSYLFYNLPPRLWDIFCDENIAMDFCHRLMEHHYSVPDYSLEEMDSLFSVDFLRFFMRGVYILYINKDPRITRRTDFDEDNGVFEFLEKLTPKDVEELGGAVSRAFDGYYKNHRADVIPEFEPYRTTQVDIQQKMGFHPEDRLVEKPISLNTVMRERQDLLTEYPEIAEQLAVFYYQAFKMLVDTNYIMDFRPKNIVFYSLLMREWAILTENVCVCIFENDGRRRAQIVDPDSVDHFRVGLDKGVAKSGLMATERVKWSLKGAVGRALTYVARNRGIRGAQEGLPIHEQAGFWTKDLAEEIRRRVATVLPDLTSRD